MMRFAMATTTAAALASAETAKPTWCETCAQGFADNGGCEALRDGNIDPMPMVPQGCTEDCGHEAGEVCRKGTTDDLPSFSLVTARAFASLAETAYCGPSENLTSWTCDPCRDAGVNVEPKQGHSESVRWVQQAAFGDIFSKFAYVARLGPNAGSTPLENGCVLSVRGSDNTANFIKDVEVSRKSVDVCEGCKTAHGFQTLWNEMREEIIGNLAQIGCVPEGDPLFVTGHSLGAAVATIATVELMIMGFDVRSAYFFESPRLGNVQYAQFFDNHFGGKDVWRITHDRDPVPSMPYGFGYQHTGQEVFFDNNEEHHICTSYQYCEQFKPFFRLYPSDHCQSPLVPQFDRIGDQSDMCHCRGWLPLGQAQPAVV